MDWFDSESVLSLRRLAAEKMAALRSRARLPAVVMLGPEDGMRCARPRADAPRGVLLSASRTVGPVLSCSDACSVAGSRLEGLAPPANASGLRLYASPDSAMLPPRPAADTTNDSAHSKSPSARYYSARAALPARNASQLCRSNSPSYSRRAIIHQPAIPVAASIIPLVAAVIVSAPCADLHPIMGGVTVPKAIATPCANQLRHTHRLAIRQKPRTVCLQILVHVIEPPSSDLYRHGAMTRQASTLPLQQHFA